MTWDRDELRDMLAEAISESVDLDWQPKDGAECVLARLEKEGLAIQPSLPALCRQLGAENASLHYHADHTNIEGELAPFFGAALGFASGEQAYGSSSDLFRAHANAAADHAGNAPARALRRQGEAA